MPLAESSDRYELYNMKEQKDWGFLKTEYESLYRGKGVFSNICVLAKLLGCKTVLIEKDYIDYDYRNEFSYFYSGVFTSYSNLCTRLHFFKNYIASIENLKDTQENYDYLGYTIIRPIEVGKVGRTALRPWVHDPDRDYHLCVSSYKAHVFGREFSVIGTPFIQQDTMIMRCAQASIWIATRVLSQQYDFLPRCLPYEITEAATRYPSWVGRAIPSTGLTVELMVNSLTQLGYSPLVYSKEHLPSEIWDPTAIIYKYVESQIPVIAIVPSHAITIIGHTFDPQPHITVTKELKEERVIHSDKWVDGFIVHDDALGPYRLLPISDEAKENFVKSPRKHLLPPEIWPYHTTNDIRAIIIPMPFKVYFPGIAVDPHVNWALKNKEFLTYVLHSANQGNSTSMDFLNSLLKPDQNALVSRTYFVSSEKYKAALRVHPLSDEMIPQLRDKYENMKMPHFIWITEITNASRLSQEHEKDRSILGEIIIDCTGNRYGLAFLSVHLPGVFISRDPYSGKWRATSLPNDRPYHHPSRQLRS